MSDDKTPPDPGTTDTGSTDDTATKDTVNNDGTQNDPKKGDDGNSAQEPQERVVPEKYDLKLPDGAVLDATAVSNISEFAKKNGFTNTEAQALLERENTIIASIAQGQKEQLEKEQKAWLETLKSDKEIGGESLGKNVELAKRVIDRFGTEEFKKSLDNSGLGNHPELVRFLVKLGKSMSPDELVLGGNTSSTLKSTAEILYPQKDKE